MHSKPNNIKGSKRDESNPSENQEAKSIGRARCIPL